MSQRGKKGTGSVNKVVGKDGSAQIVVKRSDMIDRNCVGLTFKVHNGRGYSLVRPTLNMVSLGLKFGELVNTRVYGMSSKKGGKSVKKAR